MGKAKGGGASGAGTPRPRTWQLRKRMRCGIENALRKAPSSIKSSSAAPRSEMHVVAIDSDAAIIFEIGEHGLADISMEHREVRYVQYVSKLEGRSPLSWARRATPI